MTLLQISTSALAECLAAVSKAMSNKSPLVILDDALLSCEDGKYYITGGSNDISLRMPIEVNLMKGTFEPIMLPHRLLSQTLNLMPDVPVVFNVEPTGDNYSVKCEYSGKGEQKGRFSFTCTSGKNYPVMKPDKDILAQFTAEQKDFLPPLVASSGFVAQNDLMVTSKSDIRINAEGYDIVGSDGHVLYKFAHNVGTGFATGSKMGIAGDGELDYCDILLTPRTISALAYAFRKQEEINVTYTGSHVILTSGDIRLTVVAPEGKFVNYNSVIPKEQPYAVTVNKKEIMEALKRINVFANANTNAVWVRANGLLLTIGADDIDYSRASSEDVMLLESTLPEGYKISANVQHLLRLFAQVSTENIRLFLSEPSRAFLVKDDDNNTPVTQLGMPMIL
jgi:DNA polymerase-3 subunit beta